MNMGGGNDDSDDDRDDLDFTGSGSAFLSGFQVDLQQPRPGGPANKYSNASAASTELSSTVIRTNPEDRPIGGTGSRGGAAAAQAFNSYDERPIGGTGTGFYDLS